MRQLTKKRILFQLNHPAHFHLFKNCINILKSHDHEVLISIKDKDVLKDLVQGMEYKQISSDYRKNNFFSIIRSIYSRDKELYSIVKEFNPELLIGTSPEIGHVGLFTKKPSIFFGEDDVDISVLMFLGALSCYPFFSCIVSPDFVNNSVWKEKTVFYTGIQKLAYLHPKWFTPDRNKVAMQQNQRYFMLRLSAFKAYHDTGNSGISNDLTFKIIRFLSNYGQIVISSERKLPLELEHYRFKGNINDIHHYLAYCDLLIGDSQTMSVEAGLLGTPFIRYNTFVGKLKVLEEIENRYNMGFGIRAGEEETLFKKIKDLIQNRNNKQDFNERRLKFITDKINVTDFMVWFIENYPESKSVMRSNPNFQQVFKS